MTTETLRNAFKKNNFWGVSCCSTRENLSNHAPSRTDIDEVMVILALRHKSKFNSDLFWKENQFSGFPCCSNSENISIDESTTDIEEAMVILALRHKPKFHFDLFWKENLFFFSCCSTREDLSIDVSFTTVGLILTKLGWYLFSGYGQTDGHTDRH